MATRAELLALYREKQRTVLGPVNVEKSKKGTIVRKPKESRKKPSNLIESVKVEEPRKEQQESVQIFKSSNEEDLESRLAAETSKNIQLLIELETRENEVASLRALGLELHAQLDQLKTAQQNHLELEENLKQQLEQNNEINAEKEAKLENELNHSLQIIQDKESVITELNKIVDTLRQELEQLNSQPTAYADMWIQQVKIEELEKLLQDKDEQAKIFESSNDSLKKELEECNECLNVLEKSLKDSQESNTEMEQIISGMKDELLASDSMIYQIKREREMERDAQRAIQSALNETLLENKRLHGQVEEIRADYSKQTIELQDCYQVIDLLEKKFIETENLEKDQKELIIAYESLEEELQASNVQIGVLKTQATSLVKERDELHDALKEVLNENLKLHEKSTITQHIYTQTEFVNTTLETDKLIKFLKMSNSILEQEKQQILEENYKLTQEIANESRIRQQISTQQEQLKDRLLLGLQKASEKIQKLEIENKALKSIEENL